jgi:hypothetical protein
VVSKLTYYLLFSKEMDIFSELLHMKYDKVKGKYVPALNQTPHHEDMLWEWKFISTHS